MTFGQAIEQLKNGKRVGRAGWNGKNMYLYLQVSEHPWQNFIVMFTVQETLVPWLASQTDMLAEDWELVD